MRIWRTRILLGTVMTFQTGQFIKRDACILSWISRENKGSSFRTITWDQNVSSPAQIWDSDLNSKFRSLNKLKALPFCSFQIPSKEKNSNDFHFRSQSLQKCPLKLFCFVFQNSSERLFKKTSCLLTRARETASRSNRHSLIKQPRSARSTDNVSRPTLV